MTDTTRRAFLQSTASLVAASGMAANLQAAEDKPMTGAAFDNQHSPVPLPFDAKSLTGISEKLIRSHWENNYGGAIKALNTLRGRLSQALSDANTPPYVYNGLKREQLLRTGSVVLHEFYFANLGGNGRPSADLRTRIAASFGTFDAWNRSFARLDLVWEAARAGWSWATTKVSNCWRTIGWPIMRAPQLIRIQFW